MKTIENYLDDLKEKTGSDYATANALGITKQSISTMRKGGGVKDETALKIAALLEIDESAVLLAAAMSRSQGAVKTAWGNIAKKAGIAASVLVLVGSAITIDGYQNGANAAEFDSLYIMRIHVLFK